MYTLTRNPIKRELNASDIKIIAIITMLIDHIGAIIVEKAIRISVPESETQKLLRIIDEVLRSIGRLAFPIFCFFIAYGFLYTRNKWKYLSRLVIFGLISEIPFDLANKEVLFYSGYQNVYFTLAIGLLAIIGRDYLKQKKLSEKMGAILRYLSFFMFGTVAFYTFICSTTASMLLKSKLPTIFMSQYFLGTRVFLFYNFNFLIAAAASGLVSLLTFTIITGKKDKNKVTAEAVGWLIPYICIVTNQLIHADYGAKGIVIIIVTYICIEMKRGNTDAMFTGVLSLSLFNPSELCALINVIFMDRYNGQKGNRNKYLFYAFYPVHLLILGLIAHFFLIP